MWFSMSCRMLKHQEKTPSGILLQYQDQPFVPAKAAVSATDVNIRKHAQPRAMHQKGSLSKQDINNTKQTPNKCFQSAEFDIWFISLVMFLSHVTSNKCIAKSIQCTMWCLFVSQELIM